MEPSRAAVEAQADSPVVDLPGQVNGKLHPADLPELTPGLEADRMPSLTEEGPLVCDTDELKRQSKAKDAGLHQSPEVLSAVTNKRALEASPEEQTNAHGNNKKRPAHRAGSSKEMQGSSSAISSSGSRRQLGEWTLGKTLGAGSMGKVKLAVSNVTSEKVCFL